jgi:hypothetical protein
MKADGRPDDMKTWACGCVLVPLGVVLMAACGGGESVVAGEPIRCDVKGASAEACPSCIEVTITPSTSKPFTGDCEYCCAYADEDAFHELVVLGVKACACNQTNLPCSDVCTPVECNGANPSGPCVQCVSHEVHAGASSACGTLARGTCELSESCKFHLDCVAACP